MLGEGKTIPEAAKELGISENTYHQWRNQYGGMKADDAKHLKELDVRTVVEGDGPAAGRWRTGR